MNQTVIENYKYWENKREVQKNVVWYSTSRNSRVAVKVIEMSDDHLLNTIKKVYDCAKRAEDLAFIEELQSYENIKYTEWLRLLSTEYVYRKWAKEIELRNQLDYFESMRDYLEEIKF